MFLLLKCSPKAAPCISRYLKTLSADIFFDGIEICTEHYQNKCSFHCPKFLWQHQYNIPNNFDNYKYLGQVLEHSERERKFPDFNHQTGWTQIQKITHINRSHS